MTILEKLNDIEAMANFLDHVVQDCDFCPCMEDGICEGFFNDCTENFKTYLLKEYNGN